MPSMPDITMRKLANGTLAAFDGEAFDYLKKLKVGADVQVRIKRQRNVDFHRKWFALVKLGFDFWEPMARPLDVEYRWMKKVTPAKDFERFRKDVTILAGFYTASYRLNGEVRIEARSINFSNMGEDEFERLYSATIDVILEHVLPQMTADEVRKTVEEMVLSFV
jgi:hypothetical protein